MKSYAVTWEIDVDADSPQDAAKQAWDLMRGANSTANVFTVCDDEGEITRVDLMEPVQAHQAAPVAPLNSSELATVLAALRNFQQEFEGCSEGFARTIYPDHFHDAEPLTMEGIDALCERLNVKQPATAEVPDAPVYVGVYNHRHGADFGLWRHEPTEEEMKAHWKNDFEPDREDEYFESYAIALTVMP